VPELSRSQLLVYGAVGVALLLVGARWVKSASAESSPVAGVDVASPDTGAESSGPDDSFSLQAGGDGDLVVHVAGAVREPGVYRLPTGSRVADAVERAGGSTGAAAVDAINLAARLADGQQIVMPARAKSAVGVASGSGVGASAAATPEGPISLGTATVEQLDTIEGIGPVTAQEIVEFRDQQGGLSSIDDLDEISGIGPATMESLRAGLQP
jgi:competence protein ComEA